MITYFHKLVVLNSISSISVYHIDKNFKFRYRLFMAKINTLLIGVGAHAKRIYLPFMKNHKIGKLSACLDIASQKTRVIKTLQELGMIIPSYFIEKSDISDVLSSTEKRLLNDIIYKHKIDAVIISTEPLSHLKYAKWALDNNLHILLDKPISTEVNVSTNTNKAKKIFSDYLKLLKKYKEKLQEKNLVFSIQAQRRFHIGFRVVRKKIIEMAKLSNCPVTFIQVFHSDGQWTFPGEFIEQTYHPYNQGYGKMSHSGFHGLDIAIWLIEASLKINKKWNNFSLWTTFIRPQDVLTQFNKNDYLNIFPNMEWNPKIRENLNKITGEVDAFTQISLKYNKEIITNINCNSLHNSFSRCGWFNSTGRDLYKGNGRIRQESYIIEQGPFQSIIINSFQSNEVKESDVDLYDVGGEFHFDVHIFRNTSLFPSLKTYEFINMKSLTSIADHGYSRGHQEDARRNCVNDFFLFNRK